MFTAYFFFLKNYMITIYDVILNIMLSISMFYWNFVGTFFLGGGGVKWNLHSGKYNFRHICK